MVKMIKETRVGVIFEGKIKDCPVTKYTTCDDVVEMVMYYSAKVDSAIEYALLETAYGVEKMLSGKTSVLKVVRSWGSAKGDMSLLVGKVDDDIKKKFKMSKAKKRMEKIIALLGMQKKDSKLINTTTAKNLDEENRDEKKFYEKCVEVHTDDSISAEKSGKLALMKRYLEDLANLSYNSQHYIAMGGPHVADTEMEESENGEETRTDLDAAFVVEFDGTLVDADDELNTCMIYEQDTSDAESAFYESDFTENDLERNVFENDVRVTEEIRELFDQCSYNHNVSYDRAMDCFMESIVGRDHVDADEGMSSMGSDI